MRVRLDSTSWDTSFMILALSLGESVVNHFARRCCEEIHLALLWILRWETRGKTWYAPLCPALTEV